MLSPLLMAWLAAQAPDVLQAAPCGREGAEYLATLDGTLHLHRAFVDPALSDEENARLAVLHQVKYVWGWLRTNPPLALHLARPAERVPHDALQDLHRTHHALLR